MQDEQKKEEKDENKTTLIKLGYNLPVVVPSKESQGFSFKNWTMKEEKEISALQKKYVGVGRFVSAVLCHMLKTIHGENFSGKKEEEKIVQLDQTDLPNVLYMWICLRLDALGNKLAMDVTCPNCRQENKKSVFLLDGMDVTTKNIEDERIVEYSLIKPFNFNDEHVTKLKITVTKWDMMEKSDNSIAEDAGLLKEAVFGYSIIGTNSEKPLHDKINLIQNIAKIDIENLSEQISKHNGGPFLVLNGECKFCKRKFNRAVEWGYDSFFGVSSLPDH